MNKKKKRNINKFNIKTCIRSIHKTASIMIKIIIKDTYIHAY